MKEFFRPTKFKFTATLGIFCFSLIVGFLTLNKEDYDNKFLLIILQPGLWLADQIGKIFDLGSPICPILPPCFEVYPLWVSVVSFIIVFYLYAVVLELFYKIVKKRSL